MALSQEEIDTQSRRPQLLATTIIYLVLTNLFYVGKLVLQPRPSKVSIWEDVCLTIAAIGGNFVHVCTLIGAANGGGEHYKHILEKGVKGVTMISHQLKTSYILAIMLTVNLAFVKFALLLLYRRLFLVNLSWLRYIWYGNLAYTICWYIGTSIYVICQCLPPPYYWDSTFEFDGVPGHYIKGACDSGNIKHLSTTIILSFISDGFLLILPIATVWKLRVESSKRTALYFVFGFGIIVMAIEIGRFVDLYFKTENIVDPTYDVTPWTILTGAEATASIVCVCWPIVAPRIWRLVWYAFRPRCQDEAVMTGYENIEQAPQQRQPGAPTTPLRPSEGLSAHSRTSVRGQQQQQQLQTAPVDSITLSDMSRAKLSENSSKPGEPHKLGKADVSVSGKYRKNS